MDLWTSAAIWVVIISTQQYFSLFHWLVAGISKPESHKEKFGKKRKKATKKPADANTVGGELLVLLTVDTIITTPCIPVHPLTCCTILVLC